MNNISLNYDVAVIGGGPSGLAAAITAARGGKSVAIFEKNSFLGGAMAIGLSPLGFLAQDGRECIAGTRNIKNTKRNIIYVKKQMD